MKFNIKNFVTCYLASLVMGSAAAIIFGLDLSYCCLGCSFILGLLCEPLGIPIFKSEEKDKK